MTVGGIRSTGLTAALGLARHVAELLAGHRSQSDQRRRPGHGRACPIWPSIWPRDWAAPGHGGIVCHCELVTRREIEAALAGPLPARDFGGLKRRTRAGMGRCQGFYCGARARGADRGPLRRPLARRGQAWRERRRRRDRRRRARRGSPRRIALRGRGVDRVLVLEREAAAGGVPRHCGHSPFGMREFGRVLTGPAYARRLRRAGPTAAGVDDPHRPCGGGARARRPPARRHARTGSDVTGRRAGPAGDGRRARRRAPRGWSRAIGRWAW